MEGPGDCIVCCCIHSQAAGAKRMTDGTLAEVMAVAAVANETARPADGIRAPVDEAFRGQPG